MTKQTENLEVISTESDLITRLKTGEHQAFERLIRNYNQRLYRIARAIVRDDMEAEDVVQETYIKAFTNLDKFQGSDRLGAWLARITTNLAIDRTRKSNRAQKLVDDLLNLAPNTNEQSTQISSSQTLSPERQAAMSQIRKLLEREIDLLPDGFREVFVLRVVEELSIEETSDILQIPHATVKTRLHRARRKLQSSLNIQLTSISLTVFPFAGARCDRITASVIEQLQNKRII
ncbi:MAG: RNA polymerase sigma factor [bacterium]|nr:RNA polymerase sigma factor [bacterium]